MESNREGGMRKHRKNSVRARIMREGGEDHSEGGRGR